MVTGRIKKLMLSLIIIAASTVLIAQAPMQFSYQAVLRNADGSVKPDQSVTVGVRILESDMATSVFEESHNSSTNYLGLINLIIGSEDELDVDWGADEYFLEIKVDGTVLGTTQLLSVPYALHAKTAETLSEGIVEEDPVFSSSVAYGISTEDIAGWENHTIDTNTQLDSAGIASLGYVAGILPDSAAISAMGFVTVPEEVSYTIGDAVHGGIVFYLSPDGKHGKVVETGWDDQNEQLMHHNGSWYDATNLFSENSWLLSHGRNYIDWRLPTRNELSQIYSNTDHLPEEYIWSSIEDTSDSAWDMDFSTGIQRINSKSDSQAIIIGVRSF